MCDVQDGHYREHHQVYGWGQLCVTCRMDIITNITQGSSLVHPICLEACAKVQASLHGTDAPSAYTLFLQADCSLSLF